MMGRWVALLLLLVSPAVAGPLNWPRDFPKPSVILHVDDGTGNGCVGGALLWTAGHVIEGTGRVHWRADAAEGRFEPEFFRDFKRDLAWIPADRLGPEAPRGVPVAKELPEAGEMLWLVSRLSSGELVRLPQWAMYIDEDGELEADGLGWPGMSGSCLLNQRGELVGIQLGTMLPVPRQNPGAVMLRSTTRYALVAGRF